MKRTNLLLSLCLFLIAGCGTGPARPFTYGQPIGQEFPANWPQKLDDGLDVGSLEEVNIDPRLIASAIDDIHSGRYGEVHSLLIYKDGRLVVEEYFPGHDYQWDGPGFHGAWVDWDRDKAHNIHSVGKSITSACVGIALDRGHIERVDQSIFDYLPEHQHLRSAGKDRITIEHLLTMTAGLEWDEWGTSYANQENDVIALWTDCDDPVACVLEKPLSTGDRQQSPIDSEPGTDFTYSGGNMVVLGEIIRNASGLDVEAFCGEYLFAPLGIEAPAWRWIGDTGVVYAGGDQRLTPREMLKFGVTYLHGGLWNRQTIVPKGWVEKSAVPHPGPDNTWFNHFLRPIPPGDNTWGPRGYSYTWWTHRFSHAGQEFPAYWAFGWGGQKTTVFPDQDAVVVFTGGNYTSADSTAKIITEYVIPAFE